MLHTRSFICTFYLICFFFQPAISQNSEIGQKLFSFGVIADVQYADVDQAGKRNYRGSLEKLENGIQQLNRYDLAFIASLGDLIDRHYESFDKPLQLMADSRAPVHHVLGNHEFSVEDARKKEVPRLLNNRKRYYSFEQEGYVMVILNGMEESMDAYPENSKKYREGKARYQQLKAAGANNAQTYNGGLGEKQLKWLEKVLKRADKKGLKAILFCHFPLLPENGLQLWGNREVLDLVHHSEAVIAFFSGHHHSGNYVKENGVHHLTFKGMVEAESDTSFGIVDVYRDRLVLNGFGDQEDRIFEFAEKNTTPE